MKRFCCLFVALLILLCGCKDNKPNSYDAIDLSYENISTLKDFKCYASYLEQDVTIVGDEAKELYKLVTEPIADLKNVPQIPQQDSEFLFLVFYNSKSDFVWSDKVTEFYGCYLIYSDGSMRSTGSPYLSAGLSYQLESSIFDSVLERTFP